MSLSYRPTVFKSVPLVFDNGKGHVTLMTPCLEYLGMLKLAFAMDDMKLSYCRETARRAISVEISSTAA